MNPVKKAVNIPYPGGDLYSRDNLYFSPLKTAEIWDLSHIVSFSFQQFSFLLMRALLHRQKYGEPLAMSGMSSDFKKNLALAGFPASMAGLQTDVFIPEIKKGNHPNFTVNQDETGFEAVFKSSLVHETAGGRLENGEKGKNKDFDYLYKYIHGNNGVVYYRTTVLNIIMFSEKNSKPQRIYTQEKDPGHTEFTFYYIKKELHE